MSTRTEKDGKTKILTILHGISLIMLTLSLSADIDGFKVTFKIMDILYV